MRKFHAFLILSTLSFQLFSRYTRAEVTFEIMAITDGNLSNTIVASSGEIIRCRTGFSSSEEEELKTGVYTVQVPGAGWVLKSRSYGEFGWQADGSLFDNSRPGHLEVMDTVIDAGLWPVTSEFDFYFDSSRVVGTSTGTIMEEFELQVPDGLSPGVYEIILANAQYGDAQGNPFDGVIGNRLFVKIPETLTLAAGWNLITFLRNPDNPSVRNFFEKVNEMEETVSFRSVWEWDGKRFRNVKELNALRGYWIYSKREIAIQYTSQSDLPEILSLKEGWNLVGIPSIGLDLSSYSTSGKFWTWTDQRYQISSQVQPERAYWIYSKDPI